MSGAINYRECLASICEKIEKQSIKFNDNCLSEENIFSVLNIVNKEVMYCRVLKYLIETNWDSFKEYVLCTAIGEEYQKDCELKRIELEYECDSPCDQYSKKGRIDILIETDNKEIIVIETKVYADDQEHQLFRYKKEIENNFKSYKCHILYLTLDGHKPREESLMCEKHDKESKKCSLDSKCACLDIAECKRISFYETISNWLENIISDFDTNSIAKQFLEVINVAKNNYDQEIGILSENLNFAKITLALSEAFPFFWEKVRNKFFEELAKELKEYGFEIKSNSDEPYKREILAYTLEKNGKLLYFCYETNFFFRTGFEDEEWKYVNKTVFENTGFLKIDFGTRKAKDAFNVKYYSNSSKKLLEWFYLDDQDDKKAAVIKNIAYTASKFFDSFTDSSD